ncbi:MAG TPA: class I SAM-dependent methyltransferase, partial [Bacillota bacterium]|nr:class I SAM-dependent methyltransferase [Bacillota bacterium]
MQQSVLEWDQIFKDYGTQKPRYDNWLEKYHDYFEARKDLPVIDLGCGFGNDTLYLTERGYRVISCDYSVEALQRLKYFIANPETRHFDMTEGLPFDEGSSNVVIADLSLHYFAWHDTQ